VSEPKKIHITSSGDFFYASISTDSMGYGISPKYIDWSLNNIMNDNARVVTDSDIKKYFGPGKIALLLEPYELHPENYWEVATGNYDYVLCHHKEWCERLGWLYYPFGGTFLAEEDWSVYAKTKDVSMFITNKNTMPGHKLRWRVFRAFGGIEYFGKAFRFVRNKLKGLEEFAFQIVIESCQARGYFTEKLIDCFLTGTIPIYWGDPDIEDHFDIYGMMLWSGDLAELAMILEEIKVNKEEITTNCSSAIAENFARAKKYVCAEDQIWERHREIFE